MAGIVLKEDAWTEVDMFQEAEGSGIDGVAPIQAELSTDLFLLIGIQRVPPVNVSC